MEIIFFIFGLSFTSSTKFTLMYRNNRRETQCIIPLISANTPADRSRVGNFRQYLAAAKVEDHLQKINNYLLFIFQHFVPVY